MRTEFEILRKLKSLENKKLQQAYRWFLSRKASNCRYSIANTCSEENNYICDHQSNGEIPACMRICLFPKTCERFVCRYNKSGIRKSMKQALRDPEKLRTIFRDIRIFLWIMHPATPTPLNYWITRIIRRFIKSSNEINNEQIEELFVEEQGQISDVTPTESEQSDVK